MNRMIDHRRRGEIDTRPGLQRNIHRRASRACQQCRQRKVKCDLTEKGAPCQNCENDGIECTASVSKRSRKYRLDNIGARSEQPTPSPTNQSVSVATSLSFNAAGTISKDTSSKYVRAGSHAAPYLLEATTQTLPEHHNSVQQERTTQGLRSASSDPTQSALEASSPSSYIKPIKRKWKPAELEFLTSQDAFSIPDLVLRDQLLLSYMLHVAPFLPIIDVPDFLDALSGKPGTQVSLILFQALMFAGSIFADLQVLLDAGFKNRIEAREYFYQKVKLLYDFECESDRIVLIQTILLCSYWYVTGNDQKDPWYWLGICKSLAISLGLNRASTYTGKSPKTSRLWRRIWWTCVSRDRITSITTRKPIQIKDEDINMSTLSFADFDTKPIMTEITILCDSPALGDCVSKMMLADIFMSKIRLLLLTGRMLESVYTLQSFAGSSSDWATFYIPKTRQDVASECITQLQREFDQNFGTLNDYCRLSYEDAGMNSTISKVLRVHRASLELLRLAAQEALHRPLAYLVLQLSPLTDPTRSMNESREMVHKTATEISSIVQSLHEDRILEFVPPLSIGCMLSAVVSHLAEIKVTQKRPSDSPNHPIHQCLEGLTSLQQMWPIARRTVQLVRQMIASSHIAYAWNFRMLSRTVESHNAADGTPQQLGKGETQSSVGVSPGSLDSGNISTLLTDSNRVYGAGVIDMNFEISPYLALMHPFPGMPYNSTFDDVFTSNSCDIFANNTMHSYGPEQTLRTSLTGDYTW